MQMSAKSFIAELASGWSKGDGELGMTGSAVL